VHRPIIFNKMDKLSALIDISCEVGDVRIYFIYSEWTSIPITICMPYVSGKFYIHVRYHFCLIDLRVPKKSSGKNSATFLTLFNIKYQLHC
jgi:hypothetical protein